MNQNLIHLIIFILFFNNVQNQNDDFILACQKGFKVSGIRRVNSFYQRKKTGSLTLECERLSQDVDDIICQPWITTPQCSGNMEGCAGNQWIGGFQAFIVENSTNAVL